MIERRNSIGEIEDKLRPLIGRDIELEETGFVQRGPLKRFELQGRPGNQVVSFFVDWIALGKGNGWKMHIKPENEEQKVKGFSICGISADFLNIYETRSGEVGFSIPYIGPVTIYPEEFSLLSNGLVDL